MSRKEDSSKNVPCKTRRGREGEWVRGRRASGRLSDPPSHKAKEDRLSDLAKRQNLELIYHSAAIPRLHRGISQGKTTSGGGEKGEGEMNAIVRNPVGMPRYNLIR